MKGAHVRLAFFDASRNDPFPSADRVGRGPSVRGGLGRDGLAGGLPGGLRVRPRAGSCGWPQGPP